jgi:DNA-binding LytR/AlgR family response regulator
VTLRVLIVDDEPLALDRIRLALQAAPGVAIAGEAHSGREALKLAQATAPDIVLLDIQMPGGSGIEVAQKLRGGCEVIFVTAFDSYAAEAFDLDASDYLLKPIRTDRLLAAIGRAVRRIEARRAGERIAELELVVRSLQRPEAKPGASYDEEIWAPRPGGVSRLPMASVIWIEAARDYLLIHTAHRSFMLRETMSGMGKRLDPARMLRVHRSAFVNKAEIETATRFGRDGVNLTLTNGAIVRVGATYRSALLRTMGAAIPNRSGRADKDDA